MQIERRRVPRMNVLLSGEIEVNKSGLDNLRVWVENLSLYGMKLIFYRNFYCGKCFALKEKVVERCNECELGNLEKVKDILKEGKVIVSTPSDGIIQQNYIMRWSKTYPEEDKLEFGVEFLFD